MNYELAACKGMDPNIFHPKRGETAEPARRVCRSCPVRRACLAEHLEEKLGVWGGTSARERRKLRSRGRSQWLAAITARREEVARLAAEGMSYAAIGRRLNVPERTVREDAYSARKKGAA